MGLSWLFILTFFVGIFATFRMFACMFRNTVFYPLLFGV